MKPIVVNAKYQVKSKLGEGGFGLVYDGDGIKSNGEVTIKLMHKQGPTEHSQEGLEYRKFFGRTAG